MLQRGRREPDDAATTSATPTDAGSAREPTADPADRADRPTGVVVDITSKATTSPPTASGSTPRSVSRSTLNINSDAAGELHVHTTPEQEIAYDAGTSTHEMTFDRPGIVEVETHDLD